MFSKKLITACAAALFASASPAKAYQLGPWEISSGPNVCTMAGDYKNGVRFSILVDKNYQWGIGLSYPGWNLTPGASIPISATVDGRLVASGRAEFIDTKIVYIGFQDAAAYVALRTGHGLQITTPYGTYSFQLTGTAKAMMATLACAKSLNAAQQVAQAPQQQPANVHFLTEEEGRFVLAKILSDTDAGGYQFVTDKDNTTVLVTFPNGGAGIFRGAVGSNTKTADEYTTVVISNRSSACAGQFLSSRKSIASTNGNVIRVIKTACRENDGATFEATTIVMRSPEGFLMEFARAAGVDGVPIGEPEAHEVTPFLQAADRYFNQK